MEETNEVKIGKKELMADLSELQQRVIKARLPVAIIFEGFSASGKGAAISSLILNFDPRGFEVYATRPPQLFERREPWLWRFAEKCPAKGDIAVFDRAWYSGMMQIDKKVKKPSQFITYFEDINMFERQLADDGCLIIKFFLHISRKEQKKRLKKLLAHQDTVWRVTARDLGDLKQYNENREFYKRMVEATDRPYAKWHIIDAKKRANVRRSVMETVKSELEAALEANENGRAAAVDVPQKPYINVKFNLLPAKKIQEYDLSLSLEQADYRARLAALQQELSDLHNVIYKEQVPVVIAYEGNDAAGKGGNIRRVAAALDPRGYSVHPVSAPSPVELDHHYLWRFFSSLPKTGHIAIFDRTWYGRVLVERVEQFTPPIRLSQAYNEINEFELMLKKWGAVLIKFWLTIDKEEQLRRFEDRQNTPAKQWKITDEDWRNREKWDLYADAVNDMLTYTNTDFAPWTVVESNSKYYARIKTLETIISSIRAHL